MKKLTSSIAILVLFGLALVPQHSYAAETGASNLNFDAMPGIRPKILPANKQLTVSMSITLDIVKFSAYCGDPNTTSFKWSVMEDIDGGLDETAGTFTVSFERSQQSVTKSSSQTVTALVSPYDNEDTYDSPLNFYTLIECPDGTNVAESARVPVAFGKGALIYTCVVPVQNGYAYSCSKGNLSTCSDNPQCGGKTCSQINVSLCGGPAPDPNSGGGGGGGGGGGTGPIASRSYFFEIKNPLRGGPNDLFDIINIATQWLLNIAIPLAVLFILYAGFLMLTAGDKPAKFDKGKKVLTNVVLGLAIIFIGRGFITLIYSVLELGGTGGGTVTGQCVGDDYMVNGKIAGGCTNGVVNNAQVCVNGKWWQAGKDLNQSCSDTCKNRVCQNGKGTCEKDADCKSAQKKIGEVCQRDVDCNSGLKCKNTMCQFPLGNEAGQACLTGQNCATGLSCDNTAEASKVVDGRKVGTCVRPN